MNQRPSAYLFALVLSIALTGCGPAEPKSPAPVKRDDAAIMREWLYGPRASTPGVTWSPSGLGIRVLAPGAGVAPQATDKVRVHYSCALKDGTVVDDSRKRGAPADLVVKTLIAGWAEGMTALKPGGKAEWEEAACRQVRD